jgi:hypothetical protein
MLIVKGLDSCRRGSQEKVAEGENVNLVTAQLRGEYVPAVAHHPVKTAEDLYPQSVETLDRLILANFHRLA